MGKGPAQERQGSVEVPGMTVLNLRRRFNRIFALLVVVWAAFCLLVQPVLMAGKAKTHYDNDIKWCNENYGPFGTLPDRGPLAGCLAQSEMEFKAGTYSGFGFVWEDGEFWSFKGYYRHMGWTLP